MDRHSNYRTNTRYIKNRAHTGNISTAELVFRFLYCLYKSIEKLLMTDAFAAGFCGVSFMLIVGIVGGIECGRLSLQNGIIFSAVILSAVSLLLYKKNKE